MAVVYTETFALEVNFKKGKLIERGEKGNNTRRLSGVQGEFRLLFCMRYILARHTGTQYTTTIFLFVIYQLCGVFFRGMYVSRRL